VDAVAGGRGRPSARPRLRPATGHSPALLDRAPPRRGERDDPAADPPPLHALVRDRGWAFSYTSMSRFIETLVYFCVVESDAWPRSSWIDRRSAPAFRRWVANECR